MKGMFVKNWVVLWGGLKFNFFLMTAFALIFAISGLVTVISSYFSAMFLGSMLLALFEYNERSKWEPYGDTLPVGRKGTVQGMYLFALSYFVGFSVLSAIVSVLIAMLLPELFNIMAALLIPLVVIFIETLHFGLTLPVFYKFGYKVFRTVFLIVLGAFGGAAGFLLSTLIDEEHVIAAGSVPFGFDLTALLPWALVLTVAALIVYFLSMLLSTKLYKTVEL